MRVSENVMNRLSMPFVFISREYHTSVSYRLWLADVSLVSYYGCTIRSSDDLCIPDPVFTGGEKKVSNDDNVTFVTNKHVLLQLENKIIEKDMSAAPQHFVIMLLCRPKSTLSSNPETHLYVYELFPKLSVRKIPHFLIFLLQLS